LALTLGVNVGILTYRVKKRYNPARGCPIEIAFLDPELQRRCNSDELGRQTWGAKWPLLRRRLISLAAAADASDLAVAPGLLRYTTGSIGARFTMDLWDGYQLALLPDPPDLASASEPEPRPIRRLTIIQIEEVQ
jgi:hypothetical protein